MKKVNYFTNPIFIRVEKINLPAFDIEQFINHRTNKTLKTKCETYNGQEIFPNHIDLPESGLQEISRRYFGTK
jgi:hypothetical protein